LVFFLLSFLDSLMLYFLPCGPRIVSAAIGVEACAVRLPSFAQQHESVCPAKVRLPSFAQQHESVVLLEVRPFCETTSSPPQNTKPTTTGALEQNKTNVGGGAGTVLPTRIW
jgi:hypothetical protein